MGYVLEALLAPPAIAEAAAASLPRTCVVRLHERIALVPITDDAAEALSPGRSRDRLASRTPAPASRANRTVAQSRGGLIAYVEAEFFGGIGRQAAVLWEHGEIALGPLVDPAPEELVVRGARAQWPFKVRPSGGRVEAATGLEWAA